MIEFLKRIGWAPSLCMLASGLIAGQVANQAASQDWKTSSTLPGINLEGLSAAQKITVFKILREQGCSCGCNMKLAQCRIEDPACSYSTGLAGVVVDAVRQGKSEKEAIALASGSRWAHQATTGKVLDDPIAIPTDGAPATGDARAAVTIVEFSDFQCPYCIAAVPQIDAVLKTFPSQVRLIFKQYPLEIHSDAYLAATAALAAQKQGKFWEMHNALFSHHDNLKRPVLLALAKENGLDGTRFEKDMDSKSVHDAVSKDVRDGDTANVEGTPTIFINGQRYNGRIELSYLKPLIDAELKKAPAAARSASSR
jgi:protein-disulfide isomerase